MERGMNLVIWLELQLLGDWVYLSGDGEGANESGTELLAGQVYPGGCGRRFVRNNQSAGSFSLSAPLTGDGNRKTGSQSSG